MFRLHAVFLLCGFSTRCPWACPAEGMLSQSWQLWCWGLCSAWNAEVWVKYISINLIMCFHSFCVYWLFLFSSSSASDLGSAAVWFIGSYEDLPCYVCSAHCPDPSHSWNQGRWSQKGLKIQEACRLFCWFLQPRSAPICKCGWRSLLYTHRTLLLHVRWTPLTVFTI